MKNTELTKIREEKKLTKGEFAKVLGISAMLLGKYEKGTCKIPDHVAQKVRDSLVATEIEVKKTVRKAARTVKEKVDDTVQSETATEIEVKKAVSKSERKAKEVAEKAATTIKESAKKISGIPNIIIQSALGGVITSEEIAKRVPKNTADVYVRVDENKLYYVLEDGETGDVDIWD